MNILVVDDCINRQKLFRRNLIGANLLAAHNNGEALKHLDIGNYDYIFLDYDANEELTDTFEETIFWIIQNYQDFTDTQFILHTLNEHARPHLVNLFNFARLNIKVCPWAWERCSIKDSQLVINERTYEDN